MIKLDISDLSSQSAQILAIIRNYINSNVFTSALVEVTAINQNKVDVAFINHFETKDGKKQEPIKVLDVLVGVIGGSAWTVSYPVAVGDIGLLITSKFNLDEYKKEKKSSVTKIKKQYEVASSIYIPLSLAIQPEITEDLEIKSKDDNTTITITKDGNITINNKGNIDLTNDGNITIDNKGSISATGEEVTIKGNSNVKIDSSQIEIGTGALESLVKTDTFIALFNAHTHTSSAPSSPTSPPVTPLPKTIGTTAVKGA